MTPAEIDAVLDTVRNVGVPVLVALFVGGTVLDMRRREVLRRRDVRVSRGLPAARPRFERSASWWVSLPNPTLRRGRHRAARVRWVRVVRWGARRELAALGRWRRGVVAVLADRPLYGPAWVGAA